MSQWVFLKFLDSLDEEIKLKRIRTKEAFEPAIKAIIKEIFLMLLIGSKKFLSQIKQIRLQACIWK